VDRWVLRGNCLASWYACPMGGEADLHVQLGKCRQTDRQMEHLARATS
jgi:hypothetical protein